MKKKTSNSVKVDKTAKTDQQLANENLNISRKTNKISGWVLILTAAFLVLGFYQFKVTKAYQEWSIKEMSRKPKFSIESREPEIIDSINKVIIFRCNLVNSGNDIAKYVQIRHPLYLDADSTLSIYVSSIAKNDIVYYRNTYCEEKNKATDSLPSIYVFSTAKNDTVDFTEKNMVSMKVYKNQEVIYFDQNESYDYSLKLHYIWQLSNMSPQTDTYYIPYFIDTDKGIFEDSIRVGNPFYKKASKGNRF